MKYNHPMYTNFMEILRYAVEKLKERGNSTMQGEVIRTIERTEQNFYFNKDDLKLTLNFILGEHYVVPYTGSDNLNVDEKFAVEADDLTAPTTEKGKAAVKEAHKRLIELERTRPSREAKEKLDRAKKVAEEKKGLVDEAQAERDRPGQELEAAKKERNKAAAELRKAEKECS